MGGFWLYYSKKSLKREVAIVLLSFTCYFGFTGDSVMAEIFVAPTILFAMGAFGLDAVSKHMNQNQRSLMGDGQQTNITLNSAAQPSDDSFTGYDKL